MPIKRADLWRKEYLERRYLEHLNDEDLAKRLRDVVNNFIVLSKEGKISLRSIEKGGSLWIELFTHVQAEYFIRKKDFPENALATAGIPKPTYPNIPKSVEALKKMNFALGHSLVKFGKRCYLEPMFNNGEIRIAPASMYSDPSLNVAIQDDEMIAIRHGLPSEVKMEIIDEKTGRPKGPLKPLGNITYTDSSSTNYYVYCAANSYDYRLPGDFEADCCVVINKSGIFKKLLESEFKKKYPDWKMFNAAVEYMDPFHARGNNPIIFFCKHFRYAYQHEYRFVWVPPHDKPKKALSPVFLEVGSLKDIAELIIF